VEVNLSGSNPKTILKDSTLQVNRSKINSELSSFESRCYVDESSILSSSQTEFTEQTARRNSKKNSKKGTTYLEFSLTALSSSKSFGKPIIELC